MARIAGVDLPPNKQIWVGLTYIHGIGTAVSKKILAKAEGIFRELLECRQEVRFAVEGEVGRDVAETGRTGIFHQVAVDRLVQFGAPAFFHGRPHRAKFSSQSLFACVLVGNGLHTRQVRGG